MVALITLIELKMAISKEAFRTSSEKNMKTSKKEKKKVYLVAHELKLARTLAGNNKSARDRALKALKQWFTQRSRAAPFTEDDFQRIWKGLFYAMWMSDKLLVQEQCAENISSLIHFPTLKDSLLFFKAGMTILCNEWFGIDQLRLDKFLMLVRRLLRQMFFALKKHGLSKTNINDFVEVLSSTILSTSGQVPIGLFMHFTEIFLEEFAKVTNGNIGKDCFVDLLRPFIKKLVTTEDHRQTGNIRKFIFIYLIRQSDLGLEYQVKYDAWKKEGFPGHINNIQKIKLDEDEIMSSDNDDDDRQPKEKPLDPRAGRVNVELPQIKFDPKLIAAALLEYKYDKDCTTKSRNLITNLADQFTKLANGIYPLGVKRVRDDDKNSYDTNIRKATNRLVKFEKKLMGKNKKRKRKNENVEEGPEVKTKRRKTASEEKEGAENDPFSQEGAENDEKALEEFIKKSERNIKKQLKNSKEKGVVKEKVKNSEKKKHVSSEDGIRSVKKQSKDSVTHNNMKKKSKRKKSRDIQSIIDNIECVFERNSGTWIVYDVSQQQEEKPTEPPVRTKQSPDNSIETVIKPTRKMSVKKNKCKSKKKTYTIEVEPKQDNLENLAKTETSGEKISGCSPKSGWTTTAEENGSLKAGSNPRLSESPQKEELFPKSEWDVPLQEGEYEICIPSRKFVNKMKTLAKKRHSVQELVFTSSKIKGKNRHSLGSNTASSLLSTPSSLKRVKINTKLNMSQEVYEHHANIRNSPAIPYDANKKPLKPLLKSTFNSTPLNPFYEKQLSVF